MSKRHAGFFDIAAVALLINSGGRLPKAELRAKARELLPASKHSPHHTANACSRYLRSEGLIVVEDRDYVAAVELSELASWLTQAQLSREAHLAQVGAE